MYLLRQFRKEEQEALHRMYQATQSELLERLRPIYLQSYESLLDKEQTIVAWKNG